MADLSVVKNWKVTEALLRQAADFLLDPQEFNIPERSLAEQQDWSDIKELELAMLELGAVARKCGAKSGFWRRLQKAARQMDLQDKVAEYESEFQCALAESNE